MIKTLVVSVPCIIKEEVRNIPTGRKLKGGMFGRTMVEYEERIFAVPDYPKTNKLLVSKLCEMIDKYAIEIGEIKEAVIRPSLDGFGYDVRLNGAYGNYEKKIPIDTNFGKNGNGKAPTPLSCLIEEFKYVFDSIVERYRNEMFVDDLRNLIDIYLQRMKECEGVV